MLFIQGKHQGRQSNRLDPLLAKSALTIAVLIMCNTIAAKQANIDASAILAEKLNASPVVKNELRIGNLGVSHKIIGVEQIKLTSSTPQYKWVEPPSAIPIAVQELHFANCSRRESQTSGYTYTHAATEEITHSFSYGFTQTVGATITGSYGAVEASVSAEFSANQQVTDTKTKSETKTWEIPITITAAPNTYQVAQMSVATTTANGSFSMEMFAEGSAVLVVNVPGSAVAIRIPIKDINHFIPDKNSRKFVLTGNVNGVMYGRGSASVSEEVELTEPLRARHCVANPLATSAGIVNNTPKAPLMMIRQSASATNKAPIKPMTGGRVVGTVDPKSTKNAIRK